MAAATVIALVLLSGYCESSGGGDATDISLVAHPSCLSAKGVVGRCRGAIPRWTFNAYSGACEQFMWGGCGDEEGNNFEEEDGCLKTCATHDKDTHVLLSSGYWMPRLGLGTAGLENDEEVIRWALDAGYTLIDTASSNAPWYKNEEAIGDVLTELKNRQHVFVTTKLYTHDHGYESCKRAVRESLARLQTDYIDLYLIHFPHCDHPSGKCEGTWQDSWRAMEELHKAGVLRSIGVSNFQRWQLDELHRIASSPQVISVIQNWHDPLHHSSAEIEWCRAKNVFFQSYSTLGGQYWKTRPNPVLTNPAIQDIASRHKRGAGQIILRWALQSNIGVLPRSQRRERILENIDVFDFELSSEDMAAINALNGKGDILIKKQQTQSEEAHVDL